MDIKIRLLRLKKKQKDLLVPLEKMGYCLTKDVLSRIINGERNKPDVLFAIHRVLSLWEAKEASAKNATQNGAGL